MRLKHIYISEYKNLKDFNLTFENDCFIDIFVGKNGSGKSNLLEALIEIFRDLFEKTNIGFDYTISYQIDDQSVKVKKDNESYFINDKVKAQTTIGSIPLPENILIYYSGHNDTITQLVNRYEGSFRRKIKGANFDESRRFIGIGKNYKSLLLTTVLLQSEDCKARKYVCDKLGITATPEDTIFNLIRPKFADARLSELGIEAIEQFDQRSHYWGADGITRDFLEDFTSCISGEFNHGDIYSAERDSYRLPINAELFREKFAETSMLQQFKMLDNLQTLGMLESIGLTVEINGQAASIEYFSDGQFQSVYIYSISEIFKEANCITLLDEPDSFMHPEWQFEFLKQVLEITEEANSTNHVLMSSHSASTIAQATEPAVNIFEFDDGAVGTNKICKTEIIKSLSAGLISFNESEARLNINHVLRNTSGAVLFTEGITDEIILETAWQKLFGDEPRNFDIQNAFSCGFLRNLIKDKSLYDNHPDRVFFSLFDFDEAYNDWVQLGDLIESDPLKGLIKKHRKYDCYSMLLPAPATGAIHHQVISPHDGSTYEGRALLTIELLFHGIEGLEDYFVVDIKRTDGFIKFVSDNQKVKFAEQEIPKLDAQHFEILRPMFEFIKQTSEAAKNANAA